MSTRLFLSFGLIEAIAKILILGLGLTLALLLTPGEYGLISLIIAVEGIAGMVMLFGLDRAIVRFYHDSKENNLCSTINSIWTLYSLVFLGFFSLFIYLNHSFLLSITTGNWIMLLFLVTLNSHMNMRLAVDRATGDSKAFLLLRLGSQVLKVALVFILLGYIRSDHAYLVASAIAVLVILILHYPVSSYQYRFTLSLNALKRYSIFSLPFVPHILSGGLLSFMDRFMLESRLGLDAVGQYSFAYVIGSSITFIFGIVAIYFEPFLYKRSEIEGQVDRTIRLYGLFLLVISVFSSILLIITLALLQDYFSSKGHAQILRLAPVVLMGHILIIFYLQANFSLTVQKKTPIIAAGSSLAALLNYILNVVLISRFGALGAAYATLLSYFVLSFGLYSVSRLWYSKNRIDMSKVLVWSVSSAILISVAAITSVTMQIVLLTALLALACSEFARQGGMALLTTRIRSLSVQEHAE